VPVCITTNCKYRQNAYRNVLEWEKAMQERMSKTMDPSFPFLCPYTVSVSNYPGLVPGSLQIPKPADAQSLYVKWCGICTELTGTLPYT
jgi:hypothetical protein